MRRRAAHNSTFQMSVYSSSECTFLVHGTLVFENTLFNTEYTIRPMFNGYV